MFKPFFLLAAGITSISYAQATNSQTTDWMPDNSFTQGVEGPAIDKHGNLYAVNFAKQGTIGKVSSQGNGEIFLTLTNDSVGNGIRFDAQGNMYIADYVNHNILIYNQEKKSVDVYAHNSEMNQPNDVAIMDNGVLFASDPNWAEETGKLWRINTDGSTTLIEDNMGTTNGIEVNPDNTVLYVNESLQRNVWKYQLDATGTPSNKTLFYQFEDHGLDGMRTDKEGNLYIARYGAGEIAVLSPKGKLLRTIALTGKHPTNIAFGGEDGKRVFVTMQKRGAIETFVNNTPGRYYN